MKKIKPLFLGHAIPFIVPVICLALFLEDCVWSKLTTECSDLASDPV